MNRIERIRQMSLAYAEGEMMKRMPQDRVPDERWLEAYRDAVLVCGYKGWCKFELDGIQVTVIENRA